MDDFLLRALAASILIAVLCGPMGCFVVWRNLAYFGAAIAHAALLGVALSLLLEISDTIGLLMVCLATAATLVLTEKWRILPADTLLGVLAHGSLALGLIIAAVTDPLRLDLMGYLFGDVLALSWADLSWMAVMTVVVAIVLRMIWPTLLAASVAEEVARAEGRNIRRAQLAYMLLLAVLIALAAKVVGLLLVTAMLIIPAAAARPFARSPEGMAILAIGLGIIAAASGLGASLVWDIPAGPSIAGAAFLIFTLLIGLYSITTQLISRPDTTSQSAAYGHQHINRKSQESQSHQEDTETTRKEKNNSQK